MNQGAVDLTGVKQWVLLGFCFLFYFCIERSVLGKLNSYELCQELCVPTRLR